MTDFILLNRAKLQMKEGYKLDIVGMMELSVLCDRFYPIEQGYITGDRSIIPTMFNLYPNFIYNVALFNRMKSVT